MKDFVRLRPDPSQDDFPGRRLRLLFDADSGCIDLLDESTLPERVHRPDAIHITEHHSVYLDHASIKWLAEAAAELVAHLEGK